MQAVQAQAAFFHDALVAERDLPVELASKPKLLSIVKIELAGLNRAIRATETASGAALVHHGAETIGSMVGGPRRAYALARGISAMSAHEGGVSAHVDPMHKAVACCIFGRH